MKLKVEIDIQEILNELFEDFNPEEESFELDLKETIRDGIVGDVKRQIIQMQSQKIREQIISETKTLINKSINDKIKNDVEGFYENGLLKVDYSKEEVSVQDWIRRHFSLKSNEYTRQLKDKVQLQSKVCVDELKQRYDMLFASQIITKLNDQDLLKDGVFKSLMAGK